MNEILVAEISGKRPGNSLQRPTEKFSIDYDHVIISNNSDGYETDWPIVNVPDDYMEWYKANCKTSENAWYAPMNRSYAIKYAKEHGYKYLVQLDDNICLLEIAYILDADKEIVRRCRIRLKSLTDYVDMLVCVLQNTDAAMAGCELAGIGPPNDSFLAERYCYSLFALKLNVCPEIFHGDFEDDIEYRLKCREMGLPVVQVAPFRYGKTGQVSSKDESGNRAAYTQAGLKRGEHIQILHGDVYSCGFAGKTASVNGTKGKCFKHHLKVFKLGVLVTDMDAIKAKFHEIMQRQDVHVRDKAIIKERHVAAG